MSTATTSTATPRGTTREWETLTWVVIAAAAVFGAVGLATSAVNIWVYQSFHATAQISDTDRAHVLTVIRTQALVTLLALIALYGSRWWWLTKTRRALAEASVDPARVLRHPLILAWRIATIVTAVVVFVANRGSTSGVGSSPINGSFLATALSPLIVVALDVLLIMAVLAVRTRMRALPPSAPAWKPSRAELANEEWRTERRF